MTAESKIPAIETQGLARSFGPVSAVSGFDLAIGRGEMFGLVGPDGAGKSTVIRLLCGLLKPTAGTARVLGFDLASQAELVKARTGYLAQSFTLYGDLTVDENIEFFADIHGVKGFQERRNELLEFTRLTPFRTRLAQALSGGMKKKLALACTLIHTPELIFLDEPSTGVDPVSRGEFWNILSNILEQGVTILMTTPYLDEAERCHRIGLIHRGSLIRTGSPDEIKTALPGSVYRVETSMRDAVYRALRTRWPSSHLVRYGDRLHFRTERGKTDTETAISQLRAEGITDVTFKKIAPSLEDVFVALMGNGAK